MAVKTYSSSDTSSLSSHFKVSEFKCKCGGTHSTLIDSTLVDKLEQLRTALNCSSIVINSGYRCSTHDKNVGGSGSGMHTTGQAADIVCYSSSGTKYSSKVVSCVAQDIGFTGIANIDSQYNATHVDTRSNSTWYGDEVVTTSKSVCSDFYSYYGLSKTDVYGTTTTSNSTSSSSASGIEVSVTIDGETYSGTLNK